jgi:hypothetical protein
MDHAIVAVSLFIYLLRHPDGRQGSAELDSH